MLIPKGSPDVRPIVLLESPFRGDRATHLAYARAALRHSIASGETPLASHLLHTQVLDDNNDTHRAAGIALGLNMLRVADGMALYVDYGESEGMVAAAKAAEEAGVRVTRRIIGKVGNPKWVAHCHKTGSGSLVGDEGGLKRFYAVPSYAQAEDLASRLNKGDVW